jgi:fucokinase
MASPAVSLNARRAYAELISGNSAHASWWNAVVLTASSERQAGRYMDEIRRRQQQGKIPEALYLAIPDAGNRRIGSGGATLNALRVLAPKLSASWGESRVLIIHSGGDSRRLPQYSLSGKLFGALPVKTPWGDVSTVFDEFLALSCSWAERLTSGLVVASGDVVLTFDTQTLNWSRPGVTGVGLRQPVEVGSQHGVYITDPDGRVYSFLQKPSAAEVAAAGGLLDDNLVAVDSGLIRFDPEITERLTQLGTEAGEAVPFMDLYRHFTMALTGQWKLNEDEHSVLRELHGLLLGQPFWCSVLDGDFTHVGTTRSFHKLVTEETNFSRLYEARQRIEIATPEGVRSAGVIIDSVLAPGSELGPTAIAIECDLNVPVSIGRGAILHGACGLNRVIDVPDSTVMHQVPITLPDGVCGVVVRVYGVEDDPKAAAWFERPIQEQLARLGIDPEAVWTNVPEGERVLWNAELFPLASIADAWRASRWLMGTAVEYSLDEWRRARRLSLASSAKWADMQRLSELHVRRMQSAWGQTAISLARSGTDIRPLLANAPGTLPLAEAGRAVQAEASRMPPGSATEAASQFYRASLFFAKAGLLEEADRAQSAAFERVQSAVHAGAVDHGHWAEAREWACDETTVAAPPRIDLGGGWSDTPPFCLDWGGTVLNIAVELNGACPIRTRMRKIDEPEIRCSAGETVEPVVFATAEQILAPADPGSPFTIPRLALALAGIIRPGQELRRVLRAKGGGLEISTSVDLPMGSGLGTSSILAATVVRALAVMCGVPMNESVLTDEVMRLEQMMTTGGGWQDQVGGIHPGAKIVTSGPGLRQRLRVEPIQWTREREREFSERLVLYDTGLQRMAKNLLRQVVGSYLAREVATVQVLHGIKTLAVEMGFAMRDGEWSYLGQLLNRHWELNQILDPHTTNAPINNLLTRVKPYVSGAKLAGAGGGGYLILLAHDRDAAAGLRKELGKVESVSIAHQGLRIANSALPQT